MTIQFITGALALIALIISIILFAARWQTMTQLPFLKNDKSEPKDSAWKGILYSFTLGMAPWAKESTRLHWVAYMRGIVFHVGIFAGLAALIASPWLDAIPFAVRAVFALITAFGAILGVAGGIARLAEPNLRGISTPDDHAAVWLVSLWLAATSIALVWFVFLPAMYVVGAIMSLYAPLGKIRHCIYFYFARLFYGLHIGRRGIASGLIEHSIPFSGGLDSHAKPSHGVGAVAAIGVSHAK